VRLRLKTKLPQFAKKRIKRVCRRRAVYLNSAYFMIATHDQASIFQHDCPSMDLQRLCRQRTAIAWAKTGQLAELFVAWRLTITNMTLLDHLYTV
jgi:hypothetical protein